MHHKNRAAFYRSFVLNAPFQEERSVQHSTEEIGSGVSIMHRDYPRAVRSFASILGIQGVYTLIIIFFSLMTLYSINQPLFIFLSFNLLNMCIFWMLLVWGMWTFKRWAYWITLLVELILLLEGVISLMLPNSLPSINGEIFLAPIIIFYLVGSRRARRAFFARNIFQ